VRNSVDGIEAVCYLPSDLLSMTVNSPLFPCSGSILIMTINYS
jgi:hypothetical protein